MSRKLYLHGGNMRHVNTLPFSDWLARIDVMLERRTGIRHLSNDAPNAYWTGLYHIGEGYHTAADNFLEDWRSGR